MRCVMSVLCVVGVLGLAGCVSLEVGTEKSPSRLEMKGLASGYGSLDGLRPYDGKILRFGLLSESERDGEIASIDVWPLAGVGVGVLGARVRLLLLDLGVGTLWYQPEPRTAGQDVCPRSGKPCPRGGPPRNSEVPSAGGPLTFQRARPLARVPACRRTCTRHGVSQPISVSNP